jgi:hypothetical protein
VPGVEQFLRDLLPADWKYDTPQIKRLMKGIFTADMVQYEAFK